MKTVFRFPYFLVVLWKVGSNKAWWKKGEWLKIKLWKALRSKLFYRYPNPFSKVLLLLFKGKEKGKSSKKVNTAFSSIFSFQITCFLLWWQVMYFYENYFDSRIGFFLHFSVEIHKINLNVLHCYEASIPISSSKLKLCTYMLIAYIQYYSFKLRLRTICLLLGKYSDIYEYEQENGFLVWCEKVVLCRSNERMKVSISSISLLRGG